MTTVSALGVEPLISVRGLRTQFGERVIHRDLDLEVQPGEIVTIIGGSGTGKTTLLREIMGLLKPRAGEVRLFGADLFGPAFSNFLRQRELRRRYGMLFQAGALFSALTVFENIALPLRRLRVLDDETIRLVVAVQIKRVGLDAQAGLLMPAQLSGGMIKRVALARALALEPELLFLDEPTAGLDPKGITDFCRLILGLRRELDLTVVMITHDPEAMFMLSDRVAVLAEQRVVAYDAIEQVVKHPHPFIQQYFAEVPVAAMLARRAILHRETEEFDTGTTQALESAGRR